MALVMLMHELGMVVGLNLMDLEEVCVCKWGTSPQFVLLLLSFISIAAGFNYDHTGYNYSDQMGGAAYTGGRNTSQQRTGFPYGRN